MTRMGLDIDEHVFSHSSTVNKSVRAALLDPVSNKVIIIIIITIINY